MTRTHAPLLVLILAACAAPPSTPTDAMPAPTDSPLFATDATYAADGGDAWDGEATRVDPGSAIRAEGFEPEALPAPWLNHILGVHGDWIDWISAGEESLTLVLSPGRGQAAAAGWSLDGNGHLTASAGSALWLIYFPEIPDGATITRFTALIDPGSTGAVSVTLQRNASGGATAMGIRSTSGASVQTVDSDSGTPVPDLVLDRTTYDYSILLDSGQSGDIVYEVTIYYTRAVLP